MSFLMEKEGVTSRCRPLPIVNLEAALQHPHKEEPWSRKAQRTTSSVVHQGHWAEG